MAGRTAQQVWVDEKARRAGYADGAALAAARGLKGYRLYQLYRAATKELVDDLDAVTTWPKDLRESLTADGFTFESVLPVTEQRSSDGQTTKVLFRLADGAEATAEDRIAVFDAGQRRGDAVDPLIDHRRSSQRYFIIDAVSCAVFT